MILNTLKALFALVFAVPSHANAGNIGRAAGNGGWGDEDADHLKK